MELQNKHYEVALPNEPTMQIQGLSLLLVILAFPRTYELKPLCLSP